MPGPSWCGARPRASKPACRTPSAGWTAPPMPRARAAVPVRLRRWSSWTRRRSASCRTGSPSTGPARPDSWATSPAPSPMPAERSTSSARTTTSAVERRRRSSASPTGRARISKRRLACMPMPCLRFEKAGYRSDAIGLALALADMRIAQGRLHDAMRTYERGLELATGQGGARPAGSGGHARGHQRDPPRAR